MKKPEMLYEGLPKEVSTTYRKEAIEKYGKKAIDRSEQSLMARGKEGFKQLQTEFEGLNDKLFALRFEAPTNSIVQKYIAQHYVITRKFWGTHKSSDPQGEAYAGLGQLYVSDKQFTMRDGQAQPEFAAFLKDAMKHFAETELDA